MEEPHDETYRTSVLLDYDRASCSLTVFLAGSFMADSGAALGRHSVEYSGPPFGHGTEPKPQSHLYVGHGIGD